MNFSFEECCCLLRAVNTRFNILTTRAEVVPGLEVELKELGELQAKLGVYVEDATSQRCSCGKHGDMRRDNGLAAGVHCDECWKNLITECRKRSW